MRKRPTVRWRVGLYAVGLVVLVGSLVWTQTTVKSLGRDLEKTRADNVALAEQVKDLGGQPVVAPPPIKGISADEVRSIVTDELSKQKASLSVAEINQIARVAAGMVPKPKDGVSPSAAQVRAVVASTVAAYCAGDKCVGKDGKDGEDGADGADGEDAPAVTDEELLASAQQALAAYCAQDSRPCDGRDGVDGKDGTDGQPGADGKDGRGVKSVTCQDDGTWLVTYTDDTTSTTDGPCRVVPVLPPGSPN